MAGQHKPDEDLRDTEAFDGFSGQGTPVEDDRPGEEVVDLAISDVDVPEGIQPDLDVELLRAVGAATKGNYFRVKRKDDYDALIAYYEVSNPLGIEVIHSPGYGMRIMRFGR